MANHSLRVMARLDETGLWVFSAWQGEPPLRFSRPTFSPRRLKPLPGCGDSRGVRDTCTRHPHIGDMNATPNLTPGPLPAKLVEAARRGTGQRDLERLILSDLILLVECGNHPAIAAAATAARSQDVERAIATAAAEMALGGRPSAPAPAPAPAPLSPLGGRAQPRQYSQRRLNPRRPEAIKDYDVERLTAEVTARVGSALRDWWRLSGWWPGREVRATLETAAAVVLPIAIPHPTIAQVPEAHVRGQDVTVSYRGALAKAKIPEPPNGPCLTLIAGGAPRGTDAEAPVPSWLLSYWRDRWASFQPSEWRRAAWAWQRALVTISPSPGPRQYRARCMARLQAADPASLASEPMVLPAEQLTLDLGLAS